MQLNVNIPEPELLRVKMDALKMGVTLNEYAIQSFQNFLAKPIDARRVYFEKVKKTSGRKITIKR